MANLPYAMKRAGLIAVLAVLLAALGPACRGVAQELRAVIAGVNDYQHERKLLGAVNDANSVADAVRPIAKSLDVLRDGQVTRTALLDAWNRELAASQRGDTLLVMFSGHGGSEWFGVSKTLPRGSLEFWVMPDFDRATPAGLEQRITGQDIEGLVRRATAKGVRTVLLADHCYSGAVYRQVGVDLPRIRQIPTLIAPGAPPITKPAGSETVLSPPLPGLTSLGASRADTPVAEVKITESGLIHGALSFAFARALTVDRHAVDPDGSGAVRVGALLDYLQNAIVEISGGDPQLRSADSLDEVLFRLTPAPAPGRAEIASGGRRVPVYVMGLPPAEGRAVVSAIADAEWADDANGARVIWQWNGGTPRLINGANQFISFNAPRELLAAAVGKIRDADELALLAAAGKMVVRVVTTSGAVRPVHIEGDRVEIVVRGLPGPHLVVFNLTWDGRVQLLYPKHDAPIAWPAAVVPIGGTTTVSEPFGEDRVVALASPNALPGVVEALSDMTADGLRGTARSHEARALLERVLAGDSKAAIATAGLFTVPAAARCWPEVIRDAVMQAACTQAQP